MNSMLPICRADHASALQVLTAADDGIERQVELDVPTGISGAPRALLDGLGSPPVPSAPAATPGRSRKAESGVARMDSASSRNTGLDQPGRSAAAEIFDRTPAVAATTHRHASLALIRL